MSHYSIGFTDYTHRGKVIRSCVGNNRADKFIEEYDTEGLDSGFIPPEYANRPDRISQIFYGDPKAFWLVCITSNKFDVFEDFRAGARVAIPND